VFDPETVRVTAAGFVFPGAAVGVDPGVIVTVQVLAGGSASAHVEVIVVPEGIGVCDVASTFVARLLLVLVIRKLRGLPVKAGFNAGSFTERARDATLTDNVADVGVGVGVGVGGGVGVGAGAGVGVGFCVGDTAGLDSPPPQPDNSTAMLIASAVRMVCIPVRLFTDLSLVMFSVRSCVYRAVKRASLANT